MFFLKNRLKIASLRIGKHRIVKNIASLRKVNIAHPFSPALLISDMEKRHSEEKGSYHPLPANTDNKHGSMERVTVIKGRFEL